MNILFQCPMCQWWNPNCYEIKLHSFVYTAKHISVWRIQVDDTGRYMQIWPVVTCSINQFIQILKELCYCTECTEQSKTVDKRFDWKIIVLSHYLYTMYSSRNFEYTINLTLKPCDKWYISSTTSIYECMNTVFQAIIASTLCYVWIILLTERSDYSCERSVTQMKGYTIKIQELFKLMFSEFQSAQSLSDQQIASGLALAIHRASNNSETSQNNRKRRDVTAVSGSYNVTVSWILHDNSTETLKGWKGYSN